MRIISKVFLVSLLVLMTSTAMAASVTIEDLNYKGNLTIPSMLGKDLVKKAKIEGKEKWCAFVVDYKISGDSNKYHDVKIRWKALKPGKKTAYVYKKTINYSNVKAGQNYAAIFIDPSYVSKQFKGKIGMEEFVKATNFQVTVEVKGEGDTVYYLKGKMAEKKGSKDFKVKKSVKEKDHSSRALYNKADSPFYAIQPDVFNPIDKK